MNPPVRPARPGLPGISSPIPSGILREVSLGAASSGATALALLERSRKEKLPLRETIQAHLASTKEAREALRRNATKKFRLSLSYSPSNEQTFDLAFAGAMAGMLGGRSPTSVDVASYTGYSLAALAWAEEFDTLSGNPDPLDAISANLIFGESYAAWDGRSAIGLTAAEAGGTIAAILVSIEVALAEVLLAGVTPGLYQSATYVSRIGPIANVDLGTTYASVLGGGLDIVSHDGAFVITFTSNYGFASSEADQSITFRLVLDGVAITLVDTVTCPTANLFAGSFTKIYSFAELLPGVHTFDVQAFTSTSTPSGAQAADNILVITETT